MRFVLSLFLLAALAVPAAAQDNPAVMEWNDPRRFSAGAQFGYLWHTDSGYAFDKEWMVGGTANWSLGKKSSIRAGGRYGFDNRVLTPSVGWHLKLGESTDPATHYGATLGYQWNRATGGRSVPEPAADEFFIGVAGAVPISAISSVGGGADYGLSSGIIETRVVLSIFFHP